MEFERSGNSILRNDGFTDVFHEASIGTFSEGSTVEYYVQATDNSPQRNTAINNNNGALYSFAVSASEGNQKPTLIATETSTITSTVISTVTSPQAPMTQGSGLNSSSLVITGIASAIAFLGGLFIRARKR